MRLIDAEWVIAGVATLKECYEKSDIDPLALKHVWTALEMVERLLKEAPTIEAPAIKVEPVRHGRWEIIVDDYDCEMMKCSHCGSEFYDGDNDTIDHLHNYCPNCGAKMNGGADNG